MKAEEITYKVTGFKRLEVTCCGVPAIRSETILMTAPLKVEMTCEKCGEKQAMDYEALNGSFLFDEEDQE